MHSSFQNQKITDFREIHSIALFLSKTGDISTDDLKVSINFNYSHSEQESIVFMSSQIIFCSADYTSNFFDSPEFFLTVLRLVGFLALPFHIFGGYCILFKTPKEMISVKWTLLNLHLTSCFSDWSLSFLGTLYFFVPLMGASPLGILTRVGMGMPEISYLLEVAIASLFSFLNVCISV